MTAQPTSGTDHTSGHRGVATASPKQVSDLTRALADSPYAATVLSELFSGTRVVGAYYTWADMESRATDLLDAIKDRLERPLSDDEFDTLVEGAWARFATPGVPRLAYDTLGEELHGALWEQVETIAEPRAAGDTSPTVTPAAPAREVAQTSVPAAPQASTGWLVLASELTEVRVALAKVNTSFDGIRALSLTVEQLAASPGERQGRYKTVASGDRERVQAANVEVAQALRRHHNGWWDISTVLAYTCAVVAERGWVPNTQDPGPASTWLLVDYLLSGATDHAPRLDPVTAAGLPDRVLPRLDAAVETADRVLADLWAHFGRNGRPLTTSWPARVPKKQRLTRALGARDVPREWLPQVVAGWAAWRALPATEGGEARPRTSDHHADWERIAPPAERPPDLPPTTAGPARSPVGI